MINDAIFSHCGMYRYELWRDKTTFKHHVLFIMLNPAFADDPTIRKCKEFVKIWGYESLCVVNLFAARTSCPATLLTHTQPNNVYSDIAVKRNIDNASMIVCAWGSNGKHLHRDEQVIKMLNGRETHCLGLNINGTPKHPLYLSYDTPLQEYKYDESTR